MSLPVLTTEPLQVNATGDIVDLWVATVVGQGEPPIGIASGTGLDSTLQIGTGQLRFDSGTGRMVVDTVTPQTPPPSATPDTGATPTPTPTSPYVISFDASSHLGGTATVDGVRSAVVQSDGTVVLAAQISDAAPGGLTPILLNGSTSATSGAIIRLSPDGTTVLSVSRLAASLWDMSCDGTDHLLIAAGSSGMFKLDPTASQVLWSTNVDAFHRVDAAADGTLVGLTGAYAVFGDNPVSPGFIRVFDAAGNSLGTFAGHAGGAPGSYKTFDVAIDSTTASVFSTGFNQASGAPSGNPVQVAYLKSQSYTGTTKWKAYDWSALQVDDPGAGGTGPTNNMADTRGLRVSMGQDGLLYVLYMAAGGNHIFRYDPFQLFTSVGIVGGDVYHQFFNSTDEHKTYFARYLPATGAFLLGQQFTARLTSGEANTAWCRSGNIQADAQGRVYIVGESGSGGGESNTDLGLPFTFQPISESEYGGGPFLLSMSADFATRLFVGRVTSGGTSTSLAVRTLAGQSKPSVVWGGIQQSTAGPSLWTHQPIQAAAAVRSDGFFAVQGSTPILGPTPTPVAATPTATPSAFPTATPSASPTALPSPTAVPLSLVAAQSERGHGGYAAAQLALVIAPAGVPVPTPYLTAGQNRDPRSLPMTIALTFDGPAPQAARGCRHRSSLRSARGYNPTPLRG